MIGTRLAHYEITAHLGSGGMGAVYRARDTKLNRDVAVKVLPEIFASDPERLARFHREAQVLASLNHPTIAHIHGFEDSNGIRALVMELVEGPTLAARLQRGKIPVSEAILIAKQIAEALEVAHEKGIIHRDLKPSNIKVSENSATVKVLDFGLATIAKAEADATGSSEGPTRISGVTEAGMILGTPAYMSPEQARGQPVDKRTDIWAFGVVLFEMLSGERAYGGATTTDILAGIVGREPDWSLLPMETPAAVRQLLARCLEKDSNRRLRDIGEARVSLSASSDWPSAAAMKPTAAKGRRGWWAALLAMVVVVGLVTFAFSRLGGDENLTSTEGSGPSRLVVLPFENLSRQTGDDWLAGAFSDSLTLGLQGLENVVLVNRERLRELGSSDSDPRQAAEVLGARYYVSGTFQRVGDDLKVVARLIETKGGAIKYQEPITDRFANLLQIEDQLAHRFATALEQSSAIKRRPPTSSITAYQAVAQATDLYLEGRFPEAIEKLESATTEDERYAEAWALLGKSYAQRSAPNNLDRGTRSEFLDRALRASQRAIDLDSSLYEARVALAATYQQLEQVDSWRDAAQKAIDMNPRLAEAYVLLGDSYGPSPAFGCKRERNAELAEKYYRNALDLNPSFGAAHARLATTLTWSARETDAVAVSENAVRLLPNNVLINRQLAVSLLWSGEADELEKQIKKVASMTPPTVLDKWMAAVLDLLRGRSDEAAATFKEVIEAGPIIVRGIDTGRIYAQAGYMKESAEHLQRVFAVDSACVTWVSQNKAFARYRENPEMRDLLSRYAIPTIRRN